MGPGRLRETGPDPLLAGAVIGIEVAVGMALGIIARKVDGGRLRERFRRDDDRGLEPEPAMMGPAPIPSTVFTPTPTPAPNRETAPTPTPASDPESTPTPTPLPAAPLAEAETVPLAPLRRGGVPEGGSRADGGSTAPVSADPPPLAPDADADDIVRAYAWDGEQQTTEPAPERKGRDWPWRRRDG